MAWPYHLLDLSTEQKHLRRELLDRYGVYAQLSALVPILAFQLYRLWVWVYSERQRTRLAYSEVPSSPVAKHARRSSSGAAMKRWRALVWWLEGEVAQGWGLRGHWIAAGVWTSWLLFLCVHQTGDDYLHITKRFGVIAASQFPIHYMLSMKSLYSPLAFVFRSSHEQLNPWHRLCGRIIYFLLLLHAVWYMNYFVQAGVLYQRLTARVVIIGILSFSMISIIATTSLEAVRRWSYRVFFVLHLFIGIGLMPLLFFHAKPLRIYVVEALGLFVADIICRQLDTITGFAIISPVPRTKLLQLRIPVPASKIGRFKEAPGQHVYLSIPPESTPAKKMTPSLHDLLFNPFTVADVSDTDVTLVIRALHGPTTQAINTLANLRKARPPIKIEGPYGTPRRFPNLASKYDRILLVAGGVGATFILPIYRDLRDQMDAEAKSLDRLAFVWSMRSGAEASWATELETSEVDSLENDENVKIYITGNSLRDRTFAPEDGSVELEELQELQRQGDEPIKASGGMQRPDLGRIVDEVFRMGSGERIAVLVCGPEGMARELRRCVGKWVGKGREVWFHNESFGW